ncbi:MAG: DsbA family oxidoreductase, partial [Vicinamibacterales bacterium]
MSDAIPAVIDLYADLTCPYAYLTHYRLREVLRGMADRVAVRHRSLALEYVNRRPTPKRAIEAELPFLMLAEPAISYRPWTAPESEWPVTVWPAFEAVACAARQSLALADDLAWAIRAAFFGDSRCIAMRHVLLDLAGSVGLDLERFTADFDSGVAKQQVIDDARAGWETLRVPGSPTLVLPSGEQLPDLGLPEVSVDESSGKVTTYRAATVTGPAAREWL